jgi:hypothetical protein
MGWVCGASLEKPGKYLLDLLVEDLAVPYPRFYGTDDAHERLCQQANIDIQDRENAHVLLEFAAHSLRPAAS